MAKSLRDIIAKDQKSAGRNVPKGEADFLDVHKVEVTDYPVKQVKKDITHKAVDTKPEEEVQKNDPGMRHGYRKNQDVQSYLDTNEEVEEIDETKKRGYTKSNFANKKKESRQRIEYATRQSVPEPTRGQSKADMRREAETAYKSFRKEEVESVEEMKRSQAEKRAAAREDIRNKMSKSEMNKREDIVKGMKKNISGFKDRYGSRAKEVMYATATKQAMK